MRVSRAPAEVAVELEQELLIPGAELILDALHPFHRGSRVLELGAGRGVLSRGLRQRASAAGARLIAVEPEASLSASLPPELVKLTAEPRVLPFPDAAFEHVVANLRLGRKTADPALLQEIGRVLRPYGRLTATALLTGSFDTLIDLFVEASEQEDLHELGALLREGRSELLTLDEAGALLDEAGFEVTERGVCERALFFEDGAQVLADPLGRGAFLSALLGPGEGVPEVPPPALARVRDAIDTYFGEEGLTVHLSVAVVCAELVAKEPEFAAVLGPSEGA